MVMSNSRFNCEVIMPSFLWLVLVLVFLVPLGPVTFSREDFSMPVWWKVKACMPTLSKLSRGKT